MIMNQEYEMLVSYAYRELLEQQQELQQAI